MSILDHASWTRPMTSSNSDRIHLSSAAKSKGALSKSSGTSNWLANRATLNTLVRTPKYLDSISSGLIWKSSPTCASQAFHSRKHSLPILFALREICLPSGPLIFQEPVRPPAPHSRTESASMPFPRDLDILRPHGSIPRPSTHMFWNPGWSSNNALFSKV